MSQNTNVNHHCFAQRGQKLGHGVFILKCMGKKPYRPKIIQDPPSNIWQMISKYEKIPSPCQLAASGEFVVRKK